MSIESMAIRLLEDTTNESQRLLLDPRAAPPWASEDTVRVMTGALSLYDDMMKLSKRNSYDREERVRRERCAHIISLLQGIYYPQDKP